MKKLMAVSCVLVAVLATGACSKTNTPAAAEKNSIDVGLQEYAFLVSGQAKAGQLTFNFENKGQEPHMAILGRLDAGKTLQDVRTEVVNSTSQTGPPSWFHDTSPHLALLTPGQKSGLTVDASTPGKYVFLCFVPNAQGKPHAKLGMIQDFDVAGASTAAAPATAGEFDISDTAVTTPTVAAGTSTFAVKNNGTTDRQFFIVQFAAGKTEADVNAWFGKPTGPFPATIFASADPIAGGATAIVTVTLTPGTYVVHAEDSNNQKYKVNAQLIVA